MGIILGFIAGAVTALACGIVWGQIALHFNAEIGWAAVGVGAAVGFAIRAVSRGAELPQQLLGVVCAIGGIFLGKLYAFKYFVESLYNDELGAGVTLSILSPELYEAFFGYYAEIGIEGLGFDLLWIVLAVVAAWRIAGAVSGDDFDMDLPDPEAVPPTAANSAVPAPAPVPQNVPPKI